MPTKKLIDTRERSLEMNSFLVRFSENAVPRCDIKHALATCQHDAVIWLVGYDARLDTM